jgi:hypothetical protein
MDAEIDLHTLRTRTTMKLEPGHTQMLSFDDHFEDPSLLWSYNADRDTQPPTIPEHMEDDPASWETDDSSLFIEPSLFNGMTSWADIRNFEWGFVWALPQLSIGLQPSLDEMSDLKIVLSHLNSEGQSGPEEVADVGMNLPQSDSSYQIEAQVGLTVCHSMCHTISMSNNTNSRNSFSR